MAWGPGRTGRFALIPCAALLVILLGLSTGVRADDIAPLAKQMSAEFQALAEKISPAVVHVAAERVITTQGGTDMGDMLRRFFGDEYNRRFGPNVPEQEYRQRALGSGFIVSEDGYVLTNNHVVENADKLVVKLADRREFEAKVVGTDPETDVAVLKIDGSDFPIAELGDSDAIAVGHFILAIGNPFGLDRTVSVGIVSAKGRSGVGITEYEDFIQTDAAINMGNSGGPIINMDGQVVGMSTAIFSRSGGSVGIGFAIPINMARSVMNAIIEQGHVTRGWLGVSIQDLTPPLAEALGLNRSTGALVTEVLEDTPAAEAGLKRDDLITAVDGKPVTSASQLRNTIASEPPESEVEVTILRDGVEKTITVVLGTKPVETASAQAQVSRELGFEVSDLTDELRQRFGIEDEKGVLVVSVDEGSKAYERGLRPGAVIIEVNRQPVANVEEFDHQIAQAKVMEVLLLVRYSGGSRYIVVPVSEKE